LTVSQTDASMALDQKEKRLSHQPARG